MISNSYIKNNFVMKPKSGIQLQKVKRLHNYMTSPMIQVFSMNFIVSYTDSFFFTFKIPNSIYFPNKNRQI